ncbi:acyl transferase [Cecembia rubra]|uniref:Acyl-protein synthetase LuxE n=1 Tax=Cecembia rubra TaxID=1485585 RepID=A0A2P8EA54_9BACT|nr:acyl transferase [Cecembia rubra]PSL06356.1 acyl-protein synthetase LuxE [Cecembia rubra]
MNYFKSFQEDILNFNIQDFEKKSIELFQFQAQNNPVYKTYLNARRINPDDVGEISQIPFLPVGFFKDFIVVSGDITQYEGFYSSSGTSGTITSKHYYWSEEFYLKNALNLFEKEYGSIRDFHVLALLPAYLERKGSSLVSMADYFIKESDSPYSGFYLYNHEDLVKVLWELKDDTKNVLLLGVTFALLDLAESNIKFPKMENLIVMETGGMKGRRKEMIREEVHEKLKASFHQSKIHSEYGMTELLSQAYSKGDGKYNLPITMNVLLRDVNDPLSLSSKRQGGINIIDLANFHSCAFIETQDLGRFDDQGCLEVLGRFDNSEVRGCNLMVN